MKVGAYEIVHIEAVCPPAEVDGVAVVAQIDFVERLVVVGQIVAPDDRNLRLIARRDGQLTHLEPIGSHCCCADVEIYLRRTYVVGITRIIVNSALES